MKRIIVNHHTRSVIKVSGTNVTETISLSTDLLRDSEIFIGPVSVTITYAQWNVSSDVGDTIRVVRNGVQILNLYQNSGELDLGGNGGFVDDTEEASDFSVIIVGTGNLYLSVRKELGYKSKIEPELFGSYDNPLLVGS